MCVLKSHNQGPVNWPGCVGLGTQPAPGQFSNGFTLIQIGEGNILGKSLDEGW